MRLRIVHDLASNKFLVLKRIMFFWWKNAAFCKFKNGKYYPFDSSYSEEQIQTLHEDMNLFKEKIRLSKQKPKVISEVDVK